MSDENEDMIESLFNEILDMFKLDIDEWPREYYRNVSLVDRKSRMHVAFYGHENGNARQWFSFNSKEHFLNSLGKIEHFGSFPKAKPNPFHGCNSIEEINVKLDLMLDKDEHEL